MEYKDYPDSIFMVERQNKRSDDTFYWTPQTFNFTEETGINSLKEYREKCPNETWRLVEIVYKVFREIKIEEEKL